jgi:hypothetical protein
MNFSVTGMAGEMGPALRTATDAVALRESGREVLWLALSRAMGACQGSCQHTATSCGLCLIVVLNVFSRRIKWRGDPGLVGYVISSINV